MNPDLLDIAWSLISLASLAVTAAVPIVLPPLLRRMHVATDSDLARRIEAATDAAAGLAYQYATTQTGGLTNSNVHKSALLQGVAYVTDHLPETTRLLGLTDADLHAMVSARLGALLARDPTVTAGTPSLIPAPLAVMTPP